MKRYKREVRLCTITVIATSIFYFWTRFWRFSSGFICPTFEFDSFSDFGLISILAVSFVTAVVLGINNIRLMLYPVFVAAFMWLVPSFVYVLLNNQAVNWYNFAYYMLYSFIFIFMGQLILAYLGLGIGLLIYKVYIRVTERKV